MKLILDYFKLENIVPKKIITLKSNLTETRLFSGKNNLEKITYYEGG